jgi:hypothetical protein
MPFVLADDGIIYEKAADLVFEEKKYPIYKILYKANIGASPDHNYRVYYNAKTYQMEWLEYTVTFKSAKSNDDFYIIKYNKWENTNGLVFPSEITWYNKDEKGMPTEAATKPVSFTFSVINEGKLSASFIKKPVN